MYENPLLSALQRMTRPETLAGAGIGGGLGAVAGNSGRNFGGVLGSILDAPRSASANFIEGLGDPLNMLQDQSYSETMHVPSTYDKFDSRGFLESPATGEDWDVTTSGPSAFSRMLPGGTGLLSALVAGLAGMGPAALGVGAGAAGLMQLLAGPEAPRGENALIDMLIDPSIYGGAGLGAKTLGPKIKSATEFPSSFLPTKTPLLPVPEGRLDAITESLAAERGMVGSGSPISPFSAGGGVYRPAPMPTGPQMFGATSPLEPMDPRLVTQQMLTPSQMPGEGDVMQFLESMNAPPAQLSQPAPIMPAWSPRDYSQMSAADPLQAIAGRDRRRKYWRSLDSIFG